MPGREGILSVTHLLINTIGDIGLLMWGIHMVQSGVARVFGTDLRRLLSRGLKSRLRAFLAGLGVTAVLQSSTATALMASSFAAQGSLDLVTGLAVMLGANVGTTLIVQVLSFDVSLVFPVLIVAGVMMFRRAAGTKVRDAGRILIGLGLMLLALHLLAEAIRPAQDAPAVREFLQAITREPVLNIAIAAALAWMAHSSVVVVLAVISLATTGLIGPEATLAMVVGANLGSALNPVLEGTGRDPVRLRLPAGNLLTRIVGTILVVPVIGPLAALLAAAEPDPGRIAANFHTAFNLVLAALFIGVLPAVARGLDRFLPARTSAADPAAPLYLDASAIGDPAVALANAAREALRIADVVEAMLSGTQVALHTDDRKRLAEVNRLDDVVDRLHEALQLYLAQIAQQPLSSEESRRLAEVQALALNLEHVGDIIDTSLAELATKRMRLNLSLSPEGLAEIDGMFARLADHVHLAIAVFMSSDIPAARRLVAEKDEFRSMERTSTERHFRRVREGRRLSIETSGLHLDLVRDLKRIEAHLAATAYPLLERCGELKPTRLAS